MQKTFFHFSASYLSFLRYNIFFYFLWLTITALAVASCTHKAVSSTSANSSKTASAPNPINQADPSIFYHKGTYYLYGTNDNNSNNGFIVYSSKDMENWMLNGPALKKNEAFGNWGFWAPQVWEHKGNFYMAYTANERIAIAQSKSPLGPFTQAVKKPLESSFRQIDPFIFIDDDGKKYMYHVRLDEGNHIYVAEMNDDYSAIKPETYTQCISATPNTWEHVNSTGSKIAEGPTVIKKKGFYYLFYSVNDFRNKDYAVGYAVSNNVYGPWTRYAGNPILHTKITGQAGSGHGDIVKGKGKEMYYVFHTHNTADKVGPRRSAIVKLQTSVDKDGQDMFAVDKDSFKYLSFISPVEGE